MGRGMWAGLLLSASVAGCGTPAPTPGSRTFGSTCAALGYLCGYDDFGASCGACSAGRTCESGTCVAVGPTCRCGGARCGVDNCGNSCGACASGQTCSAAGDCIAPTTTSHTLGSGVLPLFSTYGYFRFTIPTQAAVGFSTTSSAGDTYNVAIFTPTDYVTYSTGRTANAWAPHQNVTTVSDAAVLPAGTYYLGFYCTNLVERCAVSYSVVANY